MKGQDGTLEILKVSERDHLVDGADSRSVERETDLK